VPAFRVLPIQKKIAERPFGSLLDAKEFDASVQALPPAAFSTGAPAALSQ
jgi:hypothetical protein